MQKRLAAVRTDLDSFSDAEAYALMASAYRMTAHAFGEGKCVEGYTTPEREEEWDFLSVEPDMKGKGDAFTFLMRLLGVSGSLAFRIWKLNKFLKVLSWVMAVTFVVVTAWLLWTFREKKIVEAITYGAVGLFLLTTALTAIGTALVGKTLMRVIRLRETLIRAGLGLGVGVLGWVAAWLHLSVFDPMFLRLGSADNFKRLYPRAPAAPQPEEEPERAGPSRVREARVASEGVLAEAAQTASALPEVVAAGVDVLPRATPEAPGNGHADEPPPDFPDRIEIRDTDGRQS